MTLAFDHLAVAAETLEDGVQWAEATLGITPDAGGAHPLMGTHNRLLSLGPGAYLEIIAIDPNAAAPSRPRWFGLDQFRGAPRLVGWVARSDAIIAPPGTTINEASRGDLSWRIAIPDDGHPQGNGALPMLIDWKGGPHPSERLPDRGLRLTRLELSGELPTWAQISDPRISSGNAEPIRAVLATPIGEVIL